MSCKVVRKDSDDRPLNQDIKPNASSANMIDVATSQAAEPDGATTPSEEEIEAYSDRWFEDAKTLVESLRTLVDSEETPEAEIASGVDECYRLYSRHVMVKIKAANEDVSYGAAGLWTRLREGGFTWIGSWRPTVAIMLVYSLVGIHVEADLRRLLDGLDAKSMVALTSGQLGELNSLQRKIQDAEDEISTQLAILQMLMTDQHMALAIANLPSPSSSNDLSVVMDAMKPKLESLRSLVIQAEQLRLKTLRELMSVLMPVQAGQYTLAAYEMALAGWKLAEHERDFYPERYLPMTKNSNIWELASEGRTKGLEEALRSGLDPSAADTDGRTPMHAAAAKGHVETVVFLLEQGANINQRDGKGNTPLQNALEGGHHVTARYLVRRGAEALTEQEASTGGFNVMTAPDTGSQLPSTDFGINVTLQNLEDELNKRDDEEGSQDSSNDSSTGSGTGVHEL